MAERISSFKDLRVYQAAFHLQQAIFQASGAFPPEERYALTDQIRRSVRSVGANLAEAWQKRQYPAHFLSKLSDADGEQAETQHWISTARACNYITDETKDLWIEECCHIGQMLGTMMAHPEKFCASAEERQRLSH